MGYTWEITADVVVKALAALGAGFAWTYQWRGRHRSKLKADLEIFGLYKAIDPSSQRCNNLQERINRRMDRLYPPFTRHIDKGELAIGLICLVFAALLLLLGLNRSADTAEWVYIAAASLGLAGGAGVYKGFEHMFRPG